MQKTQDALFNYEKLIADEKTRITDKNDEFSKRIVPGPPEDHLDNAIKESQQKTE